MDCSPSGSSVHEILQARILEWVAIPSSRGSSLHRDKTSVSYITCIGRWVFFFTTSATWGAQWTTVSGTLLHTKLSYPSMQTSELVSTLCNNLPSSFVESCQILPSHSLFHMTIQQPCDGSKGAKLPSLSPWEKWVSAGKVMDAWSHTEPRCGVPGQRLLLNTLKPNLQLGWRLHGPGCILHEPTQWHHVQFLTDGHPAGDCW